MAGQEKSQNLYSSNISQVYLKQEKYRNFQSSCLQYHLSRLKDELKLYDLYCVWFYEKIFFVFWCKIKKCSPPITKQLSTLQPLICICSSVILFFIDMATNFFPLQQKTLYNNNNNNNNNKNGTSSALV